MKSSDLKPGFWYEIDFKGSEFNDSPWRGEAEFVQENPPYYELGTLEFICEDGEPGFFDPEDVVKEAPARESIQNQEILKLRLENLRLKERICELEKTQL